MDIRRIAIGCDHAGFHYKEHLKRWLEGRSIEVLDFGTHGESSVDYPDFIHPVASAVESGEADLGVVICGSGNGAAITANKHQGIRAALCWGEELAHLARLHNNANVLSIPARFVSIPEAEAMMQIFIETEFEGGRHEGRVKKIPCF